MSASDRSAKEQVVDELREKGRKTHEMADGVEDEDPEWAKELREKAAMYLECSDYVREAFP